MPRRKVTKSAEEVRPFPPASSMEEREDQLISAAYNLAEKRLLDGSASSQEVVHFLRLGTRRERLERQMMEKKNELLEAQAAAIKAQEQNRELYARAIRAFGIYRGESEESFNEEDIF